MCELRWTVQQSACAFPWWRHQMETFSTLLAICAGNSPVPGEFPTQRPVTRSCDVFFDLRLNTRLSKQSGGWWFGTPSRRLWRHYKVSEFSTEKKFPGAIFTCILAKGPGCVLPVNHVAVIVDPMSISVKWDPDTVCFQVISTEYGPLYRCPHLVPRDAVPIGIVSQMFYVALQWK